MFYLVKTSQGVHPSFQNKISKSVFDDKYYQQKNISIRIDISSKNILRFVCAYSTRSPSPLSKKVILSPIRPEGLSPICLLLLLSPICLVANMSDSVCRQYVPSPSALLRKVWSESWITLLRSFQTVVETHLFSILLLRSSVGILAHRFIIEFLK